MSTLFPSLIIERYLIADSVPSRFASEWDTWRVPEKQHHVVMAGIDLGNDKPKLQSSSSSNSSTKWVSPLNASGVVSDMNPFGADDYDIALAADGSVHLAAQIKAKGLNYAFHTRRNVYLAALDASSLDVKGSVKMLTSGEQGAVGSVRLSRDGNKVAWVEMATDGNESDRNQLVTYDIQKRERSDWTATWDRSPSSIQVRPRGDILRWTPHADDCLHLLTVGA